MRRTTTTLTVITAVFLAVMATGAVAGQGPRLTGKFKASGPVTGTDITGVPKDTQIKETFTFTPGCKHGGCPTVTAHRRSWNTNSTLTRTSRRVYDGTEGPTDYICITPLGNPGSFTADIHVKVTKVRHGKAKRIAGTIKTHITGCTETFENSKFTGKLK